MASSASPRGGALANALASASGTAPAPYDPSKDPFWDDTNRFWHAKQELRSLPLSSRAEFDVARSWYPTEAEVVGKLMSSARFLGVPEATAAQVMRNAMSRPYMAWVMEENGGHDPTPTGEPDDPEMDFREVAFAGQDFAHRMGAVREDMHKKGGPSVCASLLDEVRRKFDETAGEAVVERALKFAFPWRNKEALMTATFMAGWDTGRARPAKVVARREGVTLPTVKRRLKKVESVYGLSFEELRRLSAHRNGRRYLWPDERDGSLADNAKNRPDTAGRGA